MSENFYINTDITKAKTLPALFYKSEATFEALKELVFLKSWQFIGDENLVRLPQSVYPFVLLDSFLTEPMLLTRNENEHINCLSNVCTHRGNVVVLHPGKSKKLTCMYHGRRFNLKGEFEHMPEFNEVKDFPKPCDNLHQFPLRKLGPLLFAGLNPSFDFQQVIDKMNERIGFLPIDEFILDNSISKDYLVHANWALYCDNYLEGFHIPFVHKDLNSILDYGSYKTETMTIAIYKLGTLMKLLKYLTFLKIILIMVKMCRHIITGYSQI